MRRLSLLCIVGLPACFNPDDGAAAETDASTGAASAGPSTSADSAMSTQGPDSGMDTDMTGGPTSAGLGTAADTAADPTTTEPTTTDDDDDTTDDDTDDDTTDGTTGDGGTTEGFVPGCDNGVVEDDELCFDDPIALDSLVSSQGVAVGDLNDDDHLDIVVGDYGDGTTGGLRVYLGVGDGTFGKALVSEDTTPVIRVAMGPIADGIVDVVSMFVAAAGTGMRRYRGNGDGTFSTVTSYNGFSGWDVGLARLDDDDRLDALGTGPSLNLLFGTVAEGFSGQIGYGDAMSTNAYQCVQTLDVDNDEDTDVVGCGSDGIVVLNNNGTGVMSASAAFGNANNDIMVGDFDGDGYPDVAGTGASIVTVYLNNQVGGFVEQAELTVQDSPIAGDVSDLDGDGFDDLIVINTSGTTSVLLSNGDGTFATQQLYTMLEGYLYDMDMGDLNEDGVEDVVVVSPNGDPVQLLLSHI